MNNNINKIVSFLSEAGNLKNTYRYGTFKEMNSESAADHSWRLALMVITFTRELELDIDLEHALKIAVVHDLAESITGDIPAPDISFGKVRQVDKDAMENKAMTEFKKSLPIDVGQELFELWTEYESNGSKEAKFVKALDKMEALSHIIETARLKGPKVFNHIDFIATYSDKHVARFPKLLPVLKELKDRLKKEYQKAGIEWKKEYDNYLKE